MEVWDRLRAGSLAGAGAVFAGAVHLALSAQMAAHDRALGAAFVVVGALLTAGGLAIVLGRTPWALRPTGCLSLATATAYVAAHTGLVEIAHPHDHAAAVGTAATIAELLVAAIALTPRSRRAVAVVTIAALGLMLAPVVVLATEHDPAKPLACVEPNRRMNLYAEELPREDGKIRIGWGLTPGTAAIPGPLIELVEGDCIAITVKNDVSRATLEDLWKAYHDGNLPSADDAVGISLHVHGVKYTPRSDGTVQNDSWVPPGGTRTFIWYAAPRVTVGGRIVSLGTAGYWWYHDHIAGTDHGTGGLDAGLFGGMIVRRPGDLRPDVTHTVVLGPGPEINFNRYPDTFACADPPRASASCFVARQGERVEFLVLTVGNNFHTFHLHAHTWADNRTGMLTSMADETRLVDVRTLGPSETFGFQVIAGEEVGPGIWMLHCHVQDHSDDGMATFFKVLEPDGTDPVPSVPPMAGHGGHPH